MPLILKTLIQAYFPLQVSIIARQVGSHLAAYQTVAGDQLEILYHGRLSVKVR